MAEIASHHRIHHAGLGLFHSPPLHAVVLGLHQDRQPLGFTEALDFVGQDDHGFLLDVGSGKHPVRHAGEFGEADHPFSRLDADPAIAKDGHEMV